MKTTAIPFFTLLGCSLTACGDEKDTETTDTDTNDQDTSDTGDTNDTAENIGDISAVIGAWTLDSISYSYSYYGETYTTTFPRETADFYEGYGVSWSQSTAMAIFFDILETGDIELVYNYSEMRTISIDGIEIYSDVSGYSYVNSYYFYATISEDSDSYTIDFSGMLLSCTLSTGALSCIGDEVTWELSESVIPEDFEEYAEDYPETPEYTKEACVDTTITTTGNALEWGGFEDVDNDVTFVCSHEVSSYEPYYYGYYGYYGSSSYEMVDAPDEDDLVFAFEAPNDGCFAFNTTGTDFTHGIQLQDSCDSEVLNCSMTGRIEHGMEAGEQVLVVIDGEEGNDQLFNLSINEIPFNPSINDVLPADTSAMDTSEWTETVDTSCARIGSAKTFSWTATATGTATFDLLASSFDTVIQVEENSCGRVDACNDQYLGNQSLLEMEVEEGSEYTISIGGYYGDRDSGILSMNISIASAE